MARALRPRGLVPYLTVANGAEALSFYQKAFGARVVKQHTAEDGKSIVHAHLKIGDIEFMVSDYFPEMNFNKHVPVTAEKRSIVLQLFFDSFFDLDGYLDRAVEAGCEIILPFDNMYWGECYGEIKDPFGYVWAMLSPPEDKSLVKLM